MKHTLKHSERGQSRVTLLIIALLYTCTVAIGATNDATNTVSKLSDPAPKTARDFFNAGTRKLNENKLADAESLLKTALARQEEDLQPGTLYNLGHVRFSQGQDELKKGPSAKTIVERSRAVGDAGRQAMRQAEEAILGNDVQKMVDAYLAGRGARKEARAVIEAFKRAMEVYGTTLLKWQRSLGDFKSTMELNPADTNAPHNAEIVEKEIEKLLAEMRQMQQAMMPMPGGPSKFNQLMKNLKGMIPEEMMPPGAPGDDEEDEITVEALRGQEEGPSKEGEELEVSLSPEEAGNLLKSLRLDEKRGLPAGRGESGQPKDRTGKPW